MANAFLRDFHGTVQTDGYSGYDFLDTRKDIRHIGCWAHARRKFIDLTRALGKNRKAYAADRALKYIRKLYAIEKKIRTGEYSPGQIYEIRQAESKPVLDDFEKWLKKKRKQTLPKGLLGKAVAYILNQWHRLIGYIEDGNLSIDNNMAENSIRPFVLGRKNWLFSGTPEGAEASALLYSLIETAKANKLEPWAYLRYIFDRLPLGATLEDYEALLPWKCYSGEAGPAGSEGMWLMWRLRISGHCNARIEALNGIFQAAKARARGFRQDETFISMIYLLDSSVRDILKST